MHNGNVPKEYEFALPFKSNLGNCINLTDLLPLDCEKDSTLSQAPTNQVILSHRFNEVNSDDEEGRVSILDNKCNDEPYVASVPIDNKVQDVKSSKLFSKRNSSVVAQKQHV
jgi:hypothetical protein